MKMELSITIVEIDEFLKPIGQELRITKKRKGRRDLLLRQADGFLDIRLRLMHPEDDNARMDAELGELVRIANG